MIAQVKLTLAAFACLALVLLAPTASAEPYLAVQKGLKCSTCHTSPSGGGKRTPYGNLFMQNEMPARTLDMGELWTGELGKYFAVGANIRASWQRQEVPGSPSVSDTDLDEFLAYVEIKPFPKYVSIYFDARIAPDDAVIREQYVNLSLPGGNWYVRGGEFFLPYGLRIQDDEAFIRQVSGINFNTPDTGWEVGYEGGPWTAQLAVTRGTAGGPEVDSGKQYSLRVAHVTQTWRLGASYNFNDARVGDRQMQNVFAGLKTGPVAWLAEVNYIIDDGFSTGQRRSWATLLEGNYGYRKGHNLKATFEWYDPDKDVSEDEQTRISVVWEYTPIQFLQARLGYRNYSGIPQNPGQNREQMFAEVHIAF
jgi:hypothetical protein